MKRLAFLAVVACLCGCALPGIGRAGMIVYSTFGPGDSYSGSGGAIAGSGYAVYNSIAVPFSPTSTVTLDRVRFAFGAANASIPIDAVISADDGNKPGTALETFSKITPLNGIISEDSVLHPTLTAGATYWLYLQTDDPTANLAGHWSNCSPEIDGPFAYRSGANAGWTYVQSGFQQSAFDITGTVAPEPASLVMCGTGVLALWTWHQGRRKRARCSP
jgi:hypothetical protein